MSAFRKRKQKVLHTHYYDVRYQVDHVDDTDIISQTTERDFRLGDPSPTLDEQLRAGVSIKEVSTDGVLDSYDANDTPLQNFEEKIVKKGRKTKKVEPNNEE